MLKSLVLEKFTVFSEADLQFGKHLNIIVGENGTGKTHILKAAYCGIAASAARQRNNSSDDFATAIREKFLGVFRPDALGTLVC